MVNVAGSTNPLKVFIEKLKSMLIKLQNPEGWYPFAISKGKPIAGIWSTGEAVAALSQINTISPPQSKAIYNAIEWLISCQKEGGGWGVMLQERASVESTAWIILGLSKFRSRYHTSLNKAIKWLRDNQNPDGGWGSWKRDPSRATTTSFSIIALSSVERRREVLDKAIKWLRDNQNPDGGWSLGLNTQSNVFATSYAAIALLIYENDAKTARIQNAIEFLHQNQHEDGFFGDTPFSMETISRDIGITRWQHFNTPPSILALAMSGSIDTALYKGIKWLIDNHEELLSSFMLSFPYHCYISLYCVGKTSYLIDLEGFKRYLEFERKASEVQILEKKRKLKKAIIEKALLFGDFELSSQRRSNYYFDMKKITQDPAASEIIADIFLYFMESKDVDSVGGLEIGAVPIATAISMRSRTTKKPITAFFVRNQRKGHGTKRRIEGVLKKGAKVIIVDDVTTTGSSILTAISEVEKEGCHIEGIFTIIDRCEGAREVLREKGYELKPIFTIKDFKELISAETNNRTE